MELSAEIVSSLFDPVNLLFMVLGVAGGIIVGALPGLTATMALALMLPFTFSMDPEAALIMLGGIYIGAIYGGSISAILINTPGTPSSIATTFDGYPLARKGKAEHALVTAAFSSGVGGILGGLALLFFSPMLAKLALQFGPPEFFWIALFGLTIIATLSTGSVLKGFIGGAFGMLISTIGIAPIGGVSRFTFGFAPLQGGLDLIVVLIGLFCIPEVIAMVEKRDLSGKASLHRRTKGAARSMIGQLVKKPALFFRSSVVGIITGIIPGAGGNVASLLSYDVTVRLSRDKSTFGQGNPEGVAASETSNNAEVGGSLIPLLSLGIPGAPPAAVLLGALMIQGITPGPDLYSRYPDLVFLFIWAFILANGVMFLLGFFGARYVGQIINLPTHYLAPVIVMLSVVGSYAIRNNLLDVIMMVGFGVFGYWAKRWRFEPAPIVLGLILGPIAEAGLTQSMLMGQAQGSVWGVFVTRPVTLMLILLCVLSLLWPILGRIRRGAKPSDRDQGGSDDASVHR